MDYGSNHRLQSGLDVAPMAPTSVTSPALFPQLLLWLELCPRSDTPQGLDERRLHHEPGDVLLHSAWGLVIILDFNFDAGRVGRDI